MDQVQLCVYDSALTRMNHRQFNTGSPWNVPAGHGSINIDHVIAKYEKEAFAEQEKRLQQLREGSVPAERPMELPAKRTPASPQ